MNLASARFGAILLLRTGGAALRGDGERLVEQSQLLLARSLRVVERLGDERDEEGMVWRRPGRLPRQSALVDGEEVLLLEAQARQRDLALVAVRVTRP